MREVFEKNRGLFNKAFSEVISKTTFPRRKYSELRERFLAIWLDGLPNSEACNVVASCEPGVWNWEDFEQYWILTGNEPVDVRKETMDQFDLTALPDLLLTHNRTILFELYDHYNINDGVRPKGRVKNIDIIEMILGGISNENKNILHETLMNEARETGKRTYKPGYFMEMSIMLLSRILTITHNRMDYVRTTKDKELLKLRPYRTFHFTEVEHAPVECRRRHGKTIRYDDPEYEDMIPPCDFLGCCCRISSASERDVAKHAKEMNEQEARQARIEALRKFIESQP